MNEQSTAYTFARIVNQKYQLGSERREDQLCFDHRKRLTNARALPSSEWQVRTFRARSFSLGREALRQKAFGLLEVEFLARFAENQAAASGNERFERRRHGDARFSPWLALQWRGE